MNGNSALPRLDADVFGRLRLCRTATLTTQLFARGLRNTFLAGLVTLDTASARLVGEVFTLRYIPAREDLDVLDNLSGSCGSRWVISAPTMRPSGRE